MNISLLGLLSLYPSLHMLVVKGSKSCTLWNISFSWPLHGIIHYISVVEVERIDDFVAILVTLGHCILEVIKQKAVFIFIFVAEATLLRADCAY